MTRRDLFEGFRSLERRFELELPERIKKETIPSEIDDNYDRAVNLTHWWAKLKTLIEECKKANYNILRIEAEKDWQFKLRTSDISLPKLVVPEKFLRYIEVKFNKVITEEELRERQLTTFWRMSFDEKIEYIDKLVEMIYEASKERRYWIDEKLEV